MYIPIYKYLFLDLQGSSASTAGDSYVNFICNLILAGMLSKHYTVL